jgi:hypothetical protein
MFLEALVVKPIKWEERWFYGLACFCRILHANPLTGTIHWPISDSHNGC